MKNKTTQAFVSAGIVLSALVLSAFVPVSAAFAQTAPTVTVTIAKYLDGSLATPATANSADFQMNASWNADNIGAGSGQYDLGATAVAPSTTPYEVSTVDMSTGANYSTSEVMDGTVTGAACSTTAGTTTPAYTLAGYSTGATLAAAEAATPSMTAPSFTNMTANEFVIVWNTTCAPVVPVAPSTFSVIIGSNVNGALATATTANNASFQMNATWNTTNIPAGTGTYTLSATGFNTPTAYEASTGDFNSGASYTTNEVMDGTTVGAACSTTAGATTPAYTLAGYTTGATMAAAEAATPTMTAPSFASLTANEFVIVWNTTCTPVAATGTSGTIGGTVSGGVEPGALAVTSITAVNTAATADGTFTNGWKYLFNITVPDTESNLSMKFSDWTNTANGSTIPAANDIRISSAQADNADATVLLTAANTYSTPALNMTTDLDPGTPGKQVQVLVETAVPLNSVNGSYTTSYGVQTL